MPSQLARAGLASALAFAAVSAAHADLTATYTGLGDGLKQSISYTKSLSWDQAGGSNFVLGRAYSHDWVTQGSGDQFVTWCIQVLQMITPGETYTFDCVEAQFAPSAPPKPGPMGDLKADLLRDLFARWGDVSTGTIVREGTDALTDAKAAAFSLVIWEITHENFNANDLATAKLQMSLSTGAFRANIGGDVQAFYNAMYASLGQGGWLYSDLVGLTSADAQDQIRLVPAPGVLALLGLAGVGRSRRRR